jgi:hypothetical protein
MSETTISTTPVVDEKARFRAFAALGLALTALTGGGLFATAAQWIAMEAFNDTTGSDRHYWIGIALGPLAMALVALGLAGTARSSDDTLARPLARATVALAALAVVGAVLLLLITFDV